jgi:hypothetical protein
MKLLTFKLIIMTKNKNEKIPLYFNGKLDDEHKNFIIKLHVDYSDKENICFEPHDNYDLITNRKVIVRDIYNNPSPINNICKLNFQFNCKPISENEKTKQTIQNLPTLDIHIPLNRFSNHKCDYILLTIKGNVLLPNAPPTAGEPPIENSNHIENIETEEGIIIFEPPTKNKHKRNHQS